VVLHNREGLPNKLLDVSKIGRLGLITKSDGHAFATGSTRSTNSVYIGLRNVGKVIVEHVTHAIDIDSSRRNVRGNKNPNRAGLETRESARSSALRLVAVNGGRINS